MTNNTPQQPNVFGFEALVNRLYAFVDALAPSKRKTYGLGWLGIAVLFAVAASVPLGDNLRWVSASVGWPAGIIVFALVLSVFRVTRLKDLSILNYKTTTPPRKRVPVVMIGLVLIAIVLISTSSFLPLGVGGTIIIFSALLAYQVIRRTPEELALAAQGLPDPRELPEDEDEEYIYDDEDNEEEQRTK